ncbi:hypothetical protein QQ045_033355 [Rhodiola kirilowii]
METQQQAIPDDTLFEIASRCSSTDTLASLRATSKSLNLATYEPAFVSKHLASGFLIQTLVRHEYQIKYVPAEDNVADHQPICLDFLPLKVKVKACSDALGLFYCESQEQQSRLTGADVKNHYVCKAVTREWLQIPNPKTKGDSRSASGIVVTKSNPVQFKIVRLSDPKLNKQTRFSFTRYTCQIFDSEKPEKWRKLEKEIQLAKYGEWIDPDSQMVTVNMNLHLLVGQDRILSFDSVTEEWSFISTPEPSKDSYLRLKLSKYQGKLSLIVTNSTNERLTLWVMEDYNNKIWTRSSQLSLQAVYQINISEPPNRFCNSDTVLFIGYYTMYWYNFKTKSNKKVSIYNYSGSTSTFGFQSDFKKLGWKTAEDAKDCIELRRAKERARLNTNPNPNPNGDIARHTGIPGLVYSCVTIFLGWVRSSFQLVVD